jgi:hypothetical protein
VEKITERHSLLTHNAISGTLTGGSLPKRNFKGRLRQNFKTMSVISRNQSKATERTKELVE